MYITARQFNNAINVNEIITLPGQLGEWIDHCPISINNQDWKSQIQLFGPFNHLTLTLNKTLPITINGNKIVTKHIPFIVNKAFACELYLKLLLLEEGNTITNLKGKKGHNIYFLYKKTSNTFKYSLKDHMSKKGYGIIEEKIKDISNSFMEWRYIFEKLNKSIDFLFLDYLCNYLDRYSVKIILEKYSYNVDYDYR